MLDLLFLLALLAIGYAIGRSVERKHYASIERREEEQVAVPTFPSRHLTASDDDIRSAKVVYGSAVISVDFFKRFLAGLYAIIGGRVTSYEPLLDRARREAILRMKEQAQTADMIINVRVETSSISKGRSNKAVGCIEAVAYGTAVVLRG
ncbi:YbjQ family protein [Desulfobaculum sp.]